MADLLVTARVPAGQNPVVPVYTVPAGKTAEVLLANITNTSVGPVDIEITLRWHDSSAAAGANDFDWFDAATLHHEETLRGAIGDGFTAHDGDRIDLIVAGAGGQADIVLSLQVPD